MKGGNCSLLGGCANRPIQSWDIGNRLTGIPLNKNVMSPPINTNNIKVNQLGGGKIMNSIGLGHLSRIGHGLEDSIEIITQSSKFSLWQFTTFSI